MKKYFLFILITYLFNLYSLGQQSCTQNYLDAEKLFQQGFLEDVPSKLVDCIEKGFTKDEKRDAYKLIILSYLYDDRHNEAETFMTKFLKDFPEYELLETDPDVFVYLFNQYNTDPIMSVGIVGGGMFSFIGVTENHDNDRSNINRSYYSPGFGFTVGAGIYRNIMPNINADLNILYSQIKCADYDTTDNPFIDNQDLLSPTSDYIIPCISMPLSFSYNFQHTKFESFVKLGAGLGFVLRDATVSTNSVLSSSGNSSDVEAADNKVPELFKPYYWWLLAGAGIKVEIPSGFILVDLSYNRGLSPIINEDNNFVNLYLVEHLMEADEFEIDNLILTISYRYSIYNPKRKKFANK